MRGNSFNQLLTALFCFDFCYLLFSILDACRRVFHLATDVHILLFPYFLYPMQSISMTASIFMTVAVAMERFFVVHYPIGLKLVILHWNLGK
jgi:hypothetical protein